MPLASWRDLMIVLAGASVTLATLALTIMVIVMAVILFKRIKRILAITDATIGHFDEVAKLVKEEITRPVVSMAAALRGVTGFLALIREKFAPGRRPAG